MDIRSFFAASSEKKKTKPAAPTKKDTEADSSRSPPIPPNKRSLKRRFISDSDSEDNDTPMVNEPPRKKRKLDEPCPMETDETKLGSDDETANNNAQRAHISQTGSSLAELSSPEPDDDGDTNMSEATNNLNSAVDEKQREELEESDGDGDSDYHDDDEDDDEEILLDPDDDDEIESEDENIEPKTTTDNGRSGTADGRRPRPVLKSKKSTKAKKKTSKAKDRFRGSRYDVIADAGFDASKPVPYLVVAKAFSKLEATTKRLEKIEILSNLFRSTMALRPEELVQVVYLCVNKIAPPYAGLELGVGDQVIMKALQASTGRSLKDLKAQMAEVGDLGLIAEQSRQKQRTMFPPPPLKVGKVFETLIKIAQTSGHQSMGQKVSNIQLLFVSARECEARFLVRHLQGKLRTGVNEQTVFAALGRACAFTPPVAVDGEKVLDMSKKMSLERLLEREAEFTAIVKQAFSELPNYEEVVPALVQHGVEALLSHCHLTPGVPVKAMLAKPTKGVDDILKRFKDMRFTLEYKYDGERAQIHMLADGTIRIFSRNAEESTPKFPDLAANVARYANEGVTSFILDSEVVAYDRVNGKILPFQVLTHRKRKDVAEEDVSVQVCIYAFDCLFLNGESLIQKPFAERRKALHDSFVETTGEFAFATHKDSSNPEEITEFLDLAVEQSCEGLMVKTLDVEATYEPSKRSHNWLKCKKDYLDSGGDTLDLVVMGGFYGTGKRKGVYGSILVGCYDDETDGYQSICKIGTGFSDEDLVNHHKLLSGHVAAKKPMEYQSGMDCDVWFDPKVVWEVKCADLTLSPVHLAAVGVLHDSRGIALRFPRFMRTRDDKTPEDATNASQVVEMYQNQTLAA